tara:strand:+ start:157 stop:342 length:186 start_codon:yes stop_codon:yes gene_type:complete
VSFVILTFDRVQPAGEYTSISLVPELAVPLNTTLSIVPELNPQSSNNSSSKQSAGNEPFLT